jgi:hypothetical protein
MSVSSTTTLITQQKRKYDLDNQNPSFFPQFVIKIAYVEKDSLALQIIDNHCQ